MIGLHSNATTKLLTEEHSGSVLDLMLKGHWFETHQKHCVMSLIKTLDPLLSEKCPDLTEKLLTEV